jgi:hypothetical protein
MLAIDISDLLAVTSASINRFMLMVAYVDRQHKYEVSMLAIIIEN